MDWFLYDKGFRHERVKKSFEKQISVFETLSNIWDSAFFENS